jgi:hypothetical protein
MKIIIEIDDNQLTASGKNCGDTIGDILAKFAGSFDRYYRGCASKILDTNGNTVATVDIEK